MKLKLDLHPIYSDSRKIEEALQQVIEEAVAKHASEVEIIPGKGSGALKKSVIRFLARPDIRSQYHRVEKDGDNWGRLFVHFRTLRSDFDEKPKNHTPVEVIDVACAGCREQLGIEAPRDEEIETLRVECSWCGTPNILILRKDKKGATFARAELGY